MQDALQFARTSATRLYVGKRGGRASITQPEIDQLVVEQCGKVQLHMQKQPVLQTLPSTHHLHSQLLFVVVGRLPVVCAYRHLGQCTKSDGMCVTTKQSWPLMLCAMCAMCAMCGIVLQSVALNTTMCT